MIFLKISDVYEDYFGVNPANPMSTLNEEGRAKVLDYMSLLTQSRKYMKETATILTTSEVENLINGVLVITYELGMRFLEDYINNDEYFKTEYKDHNLVRAKNQIALLKDMETKVDEMNKIVYKYYERYKNRWN